MTDRVGNVLKSIQLLRFVRIFFVALPVIGLEIVAFQALSFVNDYMTATRVIAIALLGISLGGVLSFVFPKNRRKPLTDGVLFLLPLSILLSFPVIIRLNSTPVLMMVLLTLPYVLSSLYISLAFNEENPGWVYVFDLVGAGVGGLVAVAIIPILREEGSFFLLGFLASVPLMLSVVENRAYKKITKASVGAILTAALSIGLLTAHLTADPFNMIWTATAEKDYADKVFNYFRDKKGNPRETLLYSRGSLVERIDISHRIGNPDKTALTSIYNGRLVDGMNGAKASIGALDYRLPTRLKLGQNPDTLLVGPSGQGLCKAVQALGNGHVDAVEINGAIASLMTNELYDISGQAYKGFDLTVGDVRTFIERTERKYDFITMLNTHRIWSLGHQGPPEYIHSVEAMSKFLDHLKEDGYLILEERNINEQADLGIRRLIHTAKEALKQRGVTDPSKHIMVWDRFHQCSKQNMLARPPRCGRIFKFTFIGIKRTPITQKEYEHFIEWEKQLGALGNPEKEYLGFIWQYLPQLDTGHYWADVVKFDSIYDTQGADKALHNLGVITDDKPFPFDVFSKRENQWKMLTDTVLLALLMVILPAAAAFFSLRKSKTSAPHGAARVGINALLILYFGVLGIAYLVVEVMLIQKFGVFLSSPVWSLAVVLSTMLISSGFGGFVFRNLTGKGVSIVFGLLLLYGGILWWGLDGILNACMFLPFALRFAIAVLMVAPLAFLMGIPFPFAASYAKRMLTERHAGLFFGINGAFGATASPLTIILTMSLGLKATMLIGFSLYALAGVLIGLALVLGRTLKTPAAS